MTISQNPPALPGQLFPVLQGMDSLLSTTTNRVDTLNGTVTSQGTSITGLTTTVNGLGSTVSALSLTVLEHTSQINALNAKPYASAYLDSYTIGTSKTFSMQHIRGFTNSGNSLTCSVTGKYRVTLTCAKDTNPAVGGYLWLLINGTQQAFPAITYGLYNSASSSFLVQLTSGNVLTFEISGNNMWNGGAVKTTHFTLECLN